MSDPELLGTVVSRALAAAHRGALLALALEYAQHGLPVFALHGIRADNLCTCGDAACGKNAGKHPVRAGWQAAASTDETVVRAACVPPEGNIGIATGGASRVVVVDIDGAEGETTLEAYEAKHGYLPPTWTVRTARGRHLYFRLPEGSSLRNSAGKLGKGVDVRADGGYVVGAGSKHASGYVYSWEFEHSPSDREIGTMPLELVTVLSDPPVELPATLPLERPLVEGRAEKWAEAALERECASVRSAVRGTRNRTLNTAAFNMGMLVAGGALAIDDVRQSLVHAALAAKLTGPEILRTVRSGLAAGMKADARSAPARDLPYINGQAVVHSAVPVPAAEGGSLQLVAAAPPSLMTPRHDTSALFAPLPAQRWCVPGLQIGPGRPTLIAGYGSSAKTLMVQSLALAVASGRKAWERFEVERGLVIHVDHEQGLYATAKRYQRLAAGHGINAAELGRRIQYIEMPRVYLDKPGAFEQYVAACDGAALIVIDALRGAAPNSDENDSSFRNVVDLCSYISQRTGAAVVLLHHAGKPKEGHTADARTLARGSSAIFDACGCVFNVTAKPGEAARLVSQVKAPAEAQGGALDPFELVVEDVLMDACDAPLGGVRVVWRTPVIVDEVEQAEGAWERDAQRLITTVERHPGKSSNTVVGKCGVGRTRALDILKALVEDGRLVVEDGPNRTKRYRVPPLTERRGHND